MLYYADYLSADDLKKLLPYGYADVEFDKLYNAAPFLNEKAFFPNTRRYGPNAMYSGQELCESYAELSIKALKEMDSIYWKIE